MLTKIKEYILYRRGLRIVKKSIKRGIILVSELLPEVTSLLQEIKDNKDRLIDLAQYIITLDKTEVQKILNNAIINTNPDLADLDKNENKDA